MPAVLRRDVRVARPVVVPGHDGLPLGRVEELQVRVRDGACPFPVDHPVDDRHRRLRQDADRGDNDLDLVLGLLDREIRLVLPREEHVANAALNEGVGRATRAGIEHRHVGEELRQERARRLLVPARLAERVSPGGQVVPARASRRFRIRA